MNAEMKETIIPEGYKQNAIGHLVPIKLIDPVDLLRDDFLIRIIDNALYMHEQLATFKGHIVSDIETFLDLALEKYGVNEEKTSGDLKITSFDGRYRLIREKAERISFDERWKAAQVLINECMNEMTESIDQSLRNMIAGVFKIDGKGQVNVRRILSLRKYKINHPKWQQAMEAIADAITVTGSCVYYRLYVRDDKGQYQQIILDFSGV